jgi:hypothetical protein
MGNDFAEFGGKTYISFPPFPAVLMLPWVWLAGSPERFCDGQFICALAGVAPAVLFLVLERLRRSGLSERTERTNLGLCLLYAFGSVYFFTAVQGTVWFAAHVVGSGALALYILASLNAASPTWAGLALACAWTTRPSMVFAGLFFVLEALRTSTKTEELSLEGDDAASLGWWERIGRLLRDVDLSRWSGKLGRFLAPLVVSVLLAAWTNYTRFGTPNPLAFGHEHLTVVWHGRIERWGLAGYHYFPKNLGVFLTVLPWLPPKGTFCLEGLPSASPLDMVTRFASCVPFRINEHGLALWFTCPFYLWLFRPRRMSLCAVAAALAAFGPALVDLCYQNSGWRQFGYRFSNDYAVFLFVLLALGGQRFSRFFQMAAAWGLAWNLFGALSFDRSNFDRFYYREGTQTVLYQQD